MNSINYIDDPNQWMNSFSYSVPIKVRFSETDLYGHVNNTSVFVYFEEARIEYLQSLGLFHHLDIQNEGMVVADLQCNFLKQMYFDEVIDFHVKINEIGNTSFDLHYMALNKNKEVTITGRGRMVCMDFISNKSKPIPEKMREILENESVGIL